MPGVGTRIMNFTRLKLIWLQGSRSILTGERSLPPQGIFRLKSKKIAYVRERSLAYALSAEGPLAEM